MDLLVIGNISLDTIQIDGKREECIGGTGIHFSIAASLAKCKVRLLGSIGSDFPLDELPHNDYLDLDHLKISQVWTNRFQLQYDTAHNLQHTEGIFAPDQLLGHDLIPTPITVKAAHVTCKNPFHPEELVPRIKANLFSTDVSLSSITEQISSLERILPSLNLIFLNKTEYDLASRLIDFPRYSNLVEIVTKSERGVEAFQGNTRLISLPAYEVDVVDPTGAGDVMAGGCMGQLCRGETLVDALAYGSALASFSIEEFGTLHLLKKPDFEVKLNQRLNWIRERKDQNNR